MKRTILLILIKLFIGIDVFSQPSQREVKYSAVNPGLALYSSNDVYINSPEKFENGRNIIKPDTIKYPWEKRLENGMPNVIKSKDGDLGIYISSFVAHSSIPPSKVGVMAYTNNTNSIINWERPNANLFWYNKDGTTPDAKISYTDSTGYLPTNIVAVDIESLGIYNEYGVDKNGIKLIYLPQRESKNKIISGFLMDKKFDKNGILADFSQMKYERSQKQINFTFNFINGDTHMGILQHNGNYSFVSRINAKRSYLKPGEVLPFKPDPRKRYRRETITPIGKQFVSQHVNLNIALDMSTQQWEPYSMQPMQLPGFESDIWWGLVTMFGTQGDPDVQHKQRTELAISNDGFHWRYLKPGVPFLDNGTNPSSDDYGCINIALPVYNTKFSNDSTDLFYFYAASNKPHVPGRNPGVSVAIGKYGKIAGLQAQNNVKTFYSIQYPDPKKSSGMPLFSLYNALYLGNTFYPQILADVTSDPRGKQLTQLDSYTAVLLYAYDPSANNGKGMVLAGCLGSSIEGTNQISNKYEAVPFIKNGIPRTSKSSLFEYFKALSDSQPHKIISMKDLPAFPVVVETMVKNATFYGVKFVTANNQVNPALDLSSASNFEPQNLWGYSPTQQGQVYTQDFTEIKLAPNQLIPINRETGTIAISTVPAMPTNKNQTLLNMYGDKTNNNSLSITYSKEGNFVYCLTKDGIPFAEMTIAPPTGKTFAGHLVYATVEAVHKEHRKYGRELEQEVTMFRVACPELDFEQLVPQPILWNWNHPDGSITESDRANAQSFAFIAFSSFTPDLNKITIGAMNENQDFKFEGRINRVEIANYLPTGSSYFWE